MSASASVSVSSLPAVDRVLALAAVAALVPLHGRTRVVGATREVLARLRTAALDGALDPARIAEPALAQAIGEQVAATRKTRLRAVYNLTGTVLHTNFGRAILPAAAIEAVAAAQRQPVALEFDLATGRRGERDSVVESLLCELCAAQAATVVNNCAAALLLALGALGRRREVIVSRGELIEIGGSFRLPDLMRAAGVRLIEVGTTNRTHLADYAQAIGPRTALILKVHPSNYVISGFTAGVDLPELATLARAHDLPVVVDLGSGALRDLAALGLPAEPVVADTLRDGADLVLFSGDKLLGGPQAGLAVGSKALITRMCRDPLKRALRPGKLTLAALEAVLQLYREPELLTTRLTTLRDLTRPPDDIRAAAQRILPALATSLAGRCVVTIEACDSQVGSGAQPGATLPSYALALRAARVGGTSPQALARRLRELARPVVGRIAGDCLLLDLRCLDPAEEAGLCAEFGQLYP